MESGQIVMNEPEARELQRRAAEIERLCVLGIPARATSSRYEDLPSLEARVARIEAIPESLGALRERRVVLVGPSGSGKTSLAAAMLRCWRTSADGCLRRGGWASAWRLVQARRQAPLGQGECAVVQAAIDARLLVLDDLGDSADPTDTLRDVVFDRAEREHGETQLWVTTWMTPEQISARYGDGFSRRIFEGAVIIDCGNGRRLGRSACRPLARETAEHANAAPVGHYTASDRLTHSQMANDMYGPFGGPPGVKP